MSAARWGMCRSPTTSTSCGRPQCPCERRQRAPHTPCTLHVHLAATYFAQISRHGHVVVAGRSVNAGCTVLVRCLGVMCGRKPWLGTHALPLHTQPVGYNKLFLSLRYTTPSGRAWRTVASLHTFSLCAMSDSDAYEYSDLEYSSDEGSEQDEGDQELVEIENTFYDADGTPGLVSLQTWYTFPHAACVQIFSLRSRNEQ